ncbi:TOMM precursor leader peptide-binding protein [Streptomyces monashensis]|uniref:Goadsporin biosynthetic protein n=1 Tax=Streptomyces monashensis TaxID=1678012 RepID=A0A1S2PZ02_9ACTN|nr:TOMM precursor leader peptide-binding protein [Streptomyces monashensis]OIJ99069.1 goadsporin biosynthetic protein [Streptomyces monashensis]
MPPVLHFRRSLKVDVLDGDGVYLTSDRGESTVLRGRLIESLGPLLMAGHTEDDLVSKLASSFPAQSVARALRQLEEAGYVRRAETTVTAEELSAGFWENSGVDAATALSRLSSGTVRIQAAGAAAVEGVRRAWKSLGLNLTEGVADLTIVIVNDYLEPELSQINDQALADKRPWMLAKPGGSVAWFGPFFRPEEGACWECLAHRLAGNRMVETYVAKASTRSASYTPTVSLPATRGAAEALAALHAAKWLAGAYTVPEGEHRAQAAGLNPDMLHTFDTVTLAAQEQVVFRRPQCPKCGDGKLVARQHRSPVKLVSRPKVTLVDGGHRSKDPQRMLDLHGHLISPALGPVTGLHKLPSLWPGFHAYTAGQNFAIPMSRPGDLRVGLRSQSCGKGMSDLQARASALGEALERYSGVHQGDEARITAAYADLGEGAIAPNDLALYSDRQFAERAAWNERDVHFHRVLMPLDTTAPIDWTPVWSLTAQQHRYVPTASLFYGYPVDREHQYAAADSNGSAAGTSIEDATLQGFMELVERDSVALWWYNRVQRPEVDLGSFAEPYFQTWLSQYRAVGRDAWVLDLTSDFGIPVMAAISRRIDKPTEDILIAFGAHFDARIAVGRALTEMNQFLPAVVHAQADGSGYTYPDRAQQHWWQTATLENQPYLCPSPAPRRQASDYTTHDGCDLLDDLCRAQETVERLGMEMLVIDQTRPDVGLPVVKVIVPGMRHFWPRFAPGRLYDVPVELGWVNEPTREDELNPIGVFI